MGVNAPSLPRVSGNACVSAGPRSCAPLPLAWLATAHHRLGAGALGFAWFAAGRTLGCSRLPGLPSPPGPPCPALHTAGCALRAAQEGSEAELAPRAPSPSQPEPSALLRRPSAPGGDAETPAWPLESNESSGEPGGASPQRFSTRASSTLPKTHQTPRSKSLPRASHFCGTWRGR